MPQSSDAYAAANGSGATVRAAINADLQAVNSNNSGSSGPPSTVTGMQWVDTTANLVKQRDSTNASWVKVRKLNGDASVDVASAACDIGADGSKVIRITGTTTITSLGSSAPATDTPYFVRFTGAVTLTQNATSLILPGGANITTAAGDTMLALPLGSGNWAVLDYTRASGLALVAASLSGTIKQIQSSQTLTQISDASGNMPSGASSLPTSSEGSQIATVTVTPSNTGSTLYLEFDCVGDASVNSFPIFALFQDAGTTAILALPLNFQANNAFSVRLRYKITSGFTGGVATTFKIRAGLDRAGTLLVGNTTNNSPIVLSVMEVLP